MPNSCQGRDCLLQYRPTRKGCGGRQKVQAEYVRYAKELLKDGAAEGDWICVTCRDALKARASTFGVAVGDDVQVRVCAMLLQCNSFSTRCTKWCCAPYRCWQSDDIVRRE